MSDDPDLTGILNPSPLAAPPMTAADIVADLRAIRDRLADPDDPINTMQPTLPPAHLAHLYEGTTTDPRQSKP